MKLIYICSPYRGDVEYNTARTKVYCRFAYTQGALPIAVHLHNTQFLNDEIPDERQAGITLGFHMLKRCDELWIFGDRVSEGMEQELKNAKEMGIPICYFSDQCEKLDNIE